MGSMAYPTRRGIFEGDDVGISPLAVVLCVCVSVCLCLSQASAVSKRLDGTSWFGMKAAFDLSHCIFRKFRYLQNKGTSVWNFVP